MHKFNKNNLLYLVTDTKICGQRSLEKIVSLGIKGGVNLVQLREKNATTKEFLQIGRRLKSLLGVHKIPLIINDRIDVALALDADGIHLGQSDMPYDVARKILGNKKIIGLTVNTLAQAKLALTKEWQIDYLGVGPIFNTQTKLDAGSLWDIKGLKKIRQISHLPLIGIGGINASNAHKILELGFNGIAVVSAICAAKNPQKAAMQLTNIIKEIQKKY